jgi:hypothetical protein
LPDNPVFQRLKNLQKRKNTRTLITFLYNEETPPPSLLLPSLSPLPSRSQVEVLVPTKKKKKER